MNVQSSSFPSTLLQQSVAPANEASTHNLNAEILANSQQDSQKNSDFFNSAGNSELSDVISQNSEGEGSESYDLGKLAGGSQGILPGGCYCDGPTEDENGELVIACHTTSSDTGPMREIDPDEFMDMWDSRVQTAEAYSESVESNNSDIAAEPADYERVIGPIPELIAVSGGTPSERTPGLKYEMIQEHNETSTPSNNTNGPSSEVPEPYTGPVSNYGDMMRMLFGV